MKKFILIHSIRRFKNGQTEVCLKPSDDLIDDYLSTYKSYLSYDEALSDLDSFILEQTPLMFDVFINADNIPEDIRNQYEL